MSKTTLKTTIEKKVQELHEKLEALDLVLGESKSVESAGVKAIAEMQANIAESKSQLVVTDIESAKQHLSMLDEMTKDLGIQAYLNKSLVESKKEGILSALDDAYGVHKEAVALFKELDNEYVLHMRIASVNEDFAYLNGLENEINSVLGSLNTCMVRQGFVQNTSTSFTFKSSGLIHLGQTGVSTASRGFERAISQFVWEYKVKVNN
ncbi:hypothetical protein [Peribacillus butanolivorans]|uniref:hypothetical protein n=1 Tax=Peribacillus butanolivorans TaxID=421767 RepID=UPI00366C3D88